MRQEAKNGRTQGETTRTEETGNNYGRESHEAQFHIPLPLAIERFFLGIKYLPVSIVGIPKFTQRLSFVLFLRKYYQRKKTFRVYNN